MLFVRFTRHTVGAVLDPPTTIEQVVRVVAIFCSHHPVKALSALGEAEASRFRVNGLPVHPIFDLQAVKPADDNRLYQVTAYLLGKGRRWWSGYHGLRRLSSRSR